MKGRKIGFRMAVTLLFTVVLIFGLAVTANAADSAVSNWTQLSNAVSAAPTNDTATTIQLTGNITAEAQIIIDAGTNITLDLNGKTLDLNEHNIGVGGNVTFTIKDSASGGTITGGSAEIGGCISSVPGDKAESYI